jgi:hypothetical protein
MHVALSAVSSSRVHAAATVLAPINACLTAAIERKLVLSTHHRSQHSTAADTPHHSSATEHYAAECVYCMCLTAAAAAATVPVIVLHAA